MSVLEIILQDFKKKRLHTLIFAEHTTELDLIEILLDHAQIRHLRIDGSVTSAARRQEICDQFNTGYVSDTLLITLKVGGMGLNLQGAQRVVIVSPHWNPSIEEQAVARAYRIGQKENVIVYKLIIRNSIEERLVSRQVQKQQVANQVVRDVGAELKVGMNDIKELFMPLQSKEERAELEKERIREEIQKLQTE